MEKTLKVSLETATRWCNSENKEFKLLAVQLFPELAKKELPKSWEELEEFNGAFVDVYSKIEFNDRFTCLERNKNVFATKEQAEASIALAQLSQLRAVYRNGFEPDWSDKKNKFCTFIINDCNYDFFYKMLFYFFLMYFNVFTEYLEFFSK